MFSLELRKPANLSVRSTPKKGYSTGPASSSACEKRKLTGFPTSSNSTAGVSISSGGTTDNRVVGNHIGTDFVSALPKNR